MKLFSTNTLTIPKSQSYLDSITVIGSEDKRYKKQADAVWKGALGYYKTGVTPLVGMCVYKDGIKILERNVGHIDGTQKQPVALNTPVCLFSASKIVIAVVIHKLCELGKLKLTDKVSHYIPSYTGETKHNTSISDLLTHRAGIPAISGEFAKEIEPSILFDREKILSILCASPVVTKSGESVAYHAATAGFLLGEIAEKVAGTSLDTFLQTYISEPMNLGCLHFGLPVEKRVGVAQQFATGLHPKVGIDFFLKNLLNGSLETVIEMTNDERFFDAHCPAANVYTTTLDMAKFMQMLLQDGEFEGKQILQPETVAALKHSPAGLRFDRSMMVPIKHAQGVMYGSKPFGLFGFNSHKAFGHLGFTNIFCWADPKRNISVSFLCTGKPVIGTQFPAIIKMFKSIDKYL